MAETTTAMSAVSMPPAVDEQDDVPQLEDFVHTVLMEHGFNDLPEDEQQRLLPSFTEQALVRLGAAIAPKLTAEGMEEFMHLTEDEAASPEAWAGFWKQYVPDFATVAKTALEEYVEEIQILITA